jgi:hypothetical protein
MTIHVGASLLEGLGRAIAAPASRARTWCNTMIVAALRGMIITATLRRMILARVPIVGVARPGVFIICRRSVRAATTGKIGSLTARRECRWCGSKQQADKND